MSEIIKTACVGNKKLNAAGEFVGAQNADCVVTIEPGNGSIEYSLKSLVQTQYGEQITASVYDELAKYGITSARITVIDSGAIDPVLRARVEAAIKRGMGE